MSADIGIWKVDTATTDASRLDTSDRIETEEKLEALLTANPNMLEAGLTLVGRQVSVSAGDIDLLGVDHEGRLVVFELKREKLTRNAVAQVLDYCTCLETLSDLEIGTLIAEQSGKYGVKRINDFEEWYASQAGDVLKPVRMVLVGLGVDVSAERIVAYLAEKGIDISLLTFYGYKYGEGILLAKQVQTLEDSHAPRRNQPDASDLNRKASEFGVAEIWQDATAVLNHGREHYMRSGITYSQRMITLADDVRARASHSVAIHESGRIRITFYPAAVDLGGKYFEALKKEIRFKSETPPNAPATRNSPQQWFCILDEESWREGKGCLVEFVRYLEGVWRDYDPPTPDQGDGT